MSVGPAPIPVLDASSGEASLDWPGASYRAEISGGAGSWTVKHRLDDAAAIEEMIASGCAAYAAEARCPRTMYSELFTSPAPVTEVTVGSGCTRSPLFVIPGVIAVAACAVPTRHAAKIWAGGQPHAAPGTWLARGRPHKEDLAASMLLIEVTADLDDSDMSIGPYTDSDGNTRLRIRVGDAQAARLDDAAFIAQAWQAALAYVPSCEAFRLEDTASGSGFVAELAAKLDGMPLWDDDAWDPLAAATRLLGMPLPDDGD